MYPLCMAKEITLKEHLSRISKERWARMTKEQRSETGRKRVSKRWAPKAVDDLVARIVTGKTEPARMGIIDGLDKPIPEP